MRSVLWVLAALMLSGCGDGDGTQAGGTYQDADEVYRWKLITTWPKNLPGLGMGPERLADRLRIMSNGRLDIRVYGAGELVGAFEVFDAVSAGTAEMGHGAAYYWRGKIPVAAMFSTVPFGMTAQEMNAWLHHGGGMALWRELYEPFSLVPMAAGNSGMQMAGWFNKEINTIDDIRGLQMRIPGLGGEVLKRLGGEPVSMPGSDVYSSLQRGVIDAAEWVSPFNDLALGLQDIAEYYYYPGWQEPGPTTELIVNAQAWESLPEDLRMMVETTARMINEDMLSEFTAQNGRALATLRREHDVQLRRLPDDVLEKLKAASREVVAETAQGNPLAQRIHDSYMSFMAEVREYQAISEQAYNDAR
ncbi:MAG: TRAP transporter substrate-binding protein [Gammaproteobacteria bacterium]|nr:TRAP transporter substrate-binding protein [Gammaproteobacteria bacterium]